MKTIFQHSTDRLHLVGKLSDDRIKLFIDAAPVPSPEGIFHVITRDEILSALGQYIEISQVNQGVIDDLLPLLAKGEKVEERRIVKGIEPQPGQDGRLLFLVKRFTGQAEVKVDERGFAQFHELQLFESISQGKIVGRVYPPKPGVEGRDAIGKPLPAKPGQALKVQIDKTLAIENATGEGETFQVIVARADGYLAEDKGALSIKEELVVPGNVDFHVGNIDFIGSVRVKGDVLPGFSIKARKGITILGAVRGANLSATEGDIVVKGFVHGAKNTRIICAKNVECAVMHEAEVEALGSILVHKEALDCRLRSQATVEMSRGVLVGGGTWSVCGVAAKVIGNDVGKTTKIFLSSDVEMTTEYATLVVNIESHDKALQLIDLHLGPYGKNPARVTLLNEPQRGKLQKLLDKKQEVADSRIKLLGKKKALLEKAHLNTVLRVNFLEKMNEGVEVSAGEDKFAVTSAQTGPASLNYYPEEHSFKIEELKALECVIGNQAAEEKKNEKK